MALSGTGFVVLFGVAAWLYGGGAGADAAGIADYYARAASRRHQEAGFAALLVACLLLLCYVAVLRTRLSPAEPVATVLLLSGGATGVLLIAADALWAATAFSVEIQGTASVVDPGSHLLVEDAAFVLVVSAAAAAVPLVLATSREVLRGGWLPRWFAVLGWLAAAGLLGAYWYVPLALFLAWVAAGSLLLWRQGPRAADPGGRGVASRSGEIRGVG